jgi:glycosyltransferase involved in cell wall biosynthesis
MADRSSSIYSNVAPVMRVVHISYGRNSDQRDPEKWLNQINFYTAGLESLSKHCEVKSFHLIDYSGILNRNGVEYHFYRTKVFEALLLLGIHRDIQKINPEVVVVHGFTQSWDVIQLALQLGGSSKIFAVHHAEKPVMPLKSWLQKIADKFISGYFFTSCETARSFVKTRQIASLAKIHEVMIGASVFSEMSRSLAKSLTGVNGALSYLWVGGLNSNKDPLTLIRAFVNLCKDRSDSKLYMIYNDEESLTEVLNVISETNSEQSIVMVGKVSHDTLGAWYSSCDFIISTSYYEGSGIAVCEGMSCGCIPILTNISSFKMMTGDGKIGILFQPGKIEDLENALHKSTTFDIETERKRVIEHYQKTLSADAVAEQMIRAFKNP